MGCTTLLVGRAASYDGSTLMARNEDAAGGLFTAKKWIVVLPEDQPRVYRSVISGVEIPLPETPQRYTAMPNALPDNGVWGEAGVNESNVAMTETETITSNPRVLGADPLVKGGIGEEDMLTLVLPYIRSAREGVLRLGALLEQYGTYEMNGVGFQDVHEIWWMETIGGHHWIARRVPDDCYVVMPNQQGIDYFDMTDAFGAQTAHMCSADLIEFVTDHHLDLSLSENCLAVKDNTAFDVRAAFGSKADSDHSYSTARAWYMLRTLNPRSCRWDGPDADRKPDDNDLPWCLTPEHKITAEDIKYILSSHFQGTPYDPYGRFGDDSERGKYRPIGVNRTNFLMLTQLRPYLPADRMAVEWIAMGSNVFNALVPFYANVTKTPAYLAGTGKTVTTEHFYWANRIIAALADAQFAKCATLIEKYQDLVASRGHEMIRSFDQRVPDDTDSQAFLEQCNESICAMLKAETEDVLDKVLYETSMGMKNSFLRTDG